MGSSSGNGGIKSYYRQHKKKKIGITGGIAKPSPQIRSDPPSSPSQGADQVEEVQRKRKEAEERLREFDRDTRYGPVLGLTRMERWDRASAMGLCPPADLEFLLLNTQLISNSHSLWHDRV
ncbi:hypothetical protein LUZ60_011638 [Juncus effusus]|nr:hypothetical protein LUZ60_011638 [Juncus effusus]